MTRTRCVVRALAATRRALALLLALATLAVPTAPGAHAHGASDAWLRLAATPAGASMRIDVALRDLDAWVGLDADGDGSLAASEWRAREADIARAVLGAIDVSSDGRRCVAGVPAQALARRIDGTYAVLRVDLDCGGPASRASVDYRLMQGVDALHRGLLVAGDAPPLPLRPGTGPQSVELPAAGLGGERAPVTEALRAVGAFFGEGLAHILDGADHLAFVFALALGAVALSARTGRALRPTLVALAGVVTAFTVAHSITLALVALRVVAPPTRLVEAAIAASVAWAGVEAWRAARGRSDGAPLALVFAFGLVHGIGFGTALADAGLGGRPTVLALLGFNLGVEAGQLAVTALVLPVLWVARSGRTWTARVQPALAGAIVLAGALWFVERAFDLAPMLTAVRAAVR